MTHRLHEARVARRRARLVRESRWHFNRRQRRQEETAGRGHEKLHAAIPSGPRARVKVKKVYKLAPCRCKGRPNHGPHWVLVEEDGT